MSAKQQPISQPDPNQVGHVNALGMNLGRRSRIRRSKDEVSTIEIQGGPKKDVSLTMQDIKPERVILKISSHLYVTFS